MLSYWIEPFILLNIGLNDSLIINSRYLTEIIWDNKSLKNECELVKYGCGLTGMVRFGLGTNWPGSVFENITKIIK